MAWLTRGAAGGLLAGLLVVGGASSGVSATAESAPLTVDSVVPEMRFLFSYFNCIDATLAPVGDKWVMFLKDETRMPVAKKHIRVAWADAAAGPWGPASTAISTDWVEGPSALQVDGRWYLYYDAYRRRRYEGLSSNDLRTWVALDGRLQMPAGMRHGTAFAVPRAIVEAIDGP